MWQSTGFATASTVRVGSTSARRFVAATRAAGASATLPPTAPSLRLWTSVPRGFATATGKKSATTKTPKAPSAAGKRKTSAATKKAKEAKKPTAKATPKPKRKVLSEEEKRKLQIRELKDVALLREEPTKLAATAWIAFVRRENRAAPHAPGVSGKMKGLSERYNSLSSGELEKLNEQARADSEASHAAYKTWLESHTPAEIEEANRARQRLKSGFNLSTRGLIHDERIPKKSSSAFIMFCKTRFNSGEHNGTPVTEAVKDFAKDWKSMSEIEKEPFRKESSAEREKYLRLAKSVLGREVKPRKPFAASA